LLAAKVPERLEGCRMDGLDTEAWAQQGLVDILTLGSRSMDVDTAAFRRVTAGRNIKLQPCHDAYHATDGYRSPPIEFFRGVFGNWWQQGADAVVAFNWSNASPEVCERVGAEAGPASERQALLEVGSPETLRGRDKLFAVERRWGYPWTDGYANANMLAPLPAKLPNDGRETRFVVRVCDHLAATMEPIEELTVRVVLFGAQLDDRLSVTLNGIPLGAPVVADSSWKDPQIYSPQQQPTSGGSGKYVINPEQRLLLLIYVASPAQFRLGENQIEVRVADRVPYGPGDDISIEKLEVAVRYA
jgi:hypothetical protein